MDPGQEHSFYEFDLAEPIVKAIRETGYKVPTPIQIQAIPPIMEGRDVLGCAQTGTGKTAAFALPIIHRLTQCRQPPKNQVRKVRALILTPTRELAAQVDESFRTYGKHSPLRHALVFGGVGATRQIKALKPGVDILVATPGRLLDLLREEHVDLGHVEILVLDEADRMLDMGFLPDLRSIMDELPSKRQTMLFSATMDPSVAGLVASYVSNPVRIAVEACAETASRIDHYCYEVQRGSKFDLLQYLLKNEEGSFLVFLATKEGADRLTMYLEREKYKVAAIHGDRSQSQRNEALQGFKDGVYRILVATDVAARGIHVDDIGHVVNYDLPQEPENFVHRIGRTGRAGARGASWTFITPFELTDLRKYERTLGIQVQFRELPPLPRPIGLVSDADMEEMMAEMLVKMRPVPKASPAQKAPIAQKMPPADKLANAENLAPAENPGSPTPSGVIGRRRRRRS